MPDFINLNNLFLLDGFFFLLVSIIVLFSPDPRPQLREIPPDSSIPAHKDTRRLLATQFMTVGILVIFIGLSLHNVEIQNAALARAISLIILVINQVVQISQKRWKTSALRAFTALFSAFALAYIYFVLQGR